MTTETNPNGATPPPRRCENCACFARMTMDGSILEPDAPTPEKEQVFTVCRRLTPGGRQVRTEVPAFNPQTGAPIMDPRTNKQRMEMGTVMQIGYPHTLPTAVCYDGWRPLGTLPGDNFTLTDWQATVMPMLRQAFGIAFAPTLPPASDKAPPDFQRIPDGT